MMIAKYFANLKADMRGVGIDFDNIAFLRKIGERAHASKAFLCLLRQFSCYLPEWCQYLSNWMEEGR